MGSFSIHSSVAIRAHKFVNNIAVKKKSQSMEQTDQIELVCSVRHFLRDLLYITWTAHWVFVYPFLTFIITVSCYTFTFIFHINVFSPPYRFKDCLTYLSMFKWTKICSQGLRCRNQVRQPPHYSCSTTHSSTHSVLAGQIICQQLTLSCNTEHNYFAQLPSSALLHQT